MLFTVDDAKLINSNPNSNFAILSLDFFASGANRHDTFISDDTLFRTKDTIKNVPVVWIYDPITDDAYTHDSRETPCGFVPETAEITSRKMEDGRTMLTVDCYVWKKFSGRILEFFKRDGGEKPVSVEITIFEARDMDNGLVEIADYKYDAVTILGSNVTPAIPLAKSTVIQFAKEYKKDFEKEFSKYSEIDMKIPDGIKKNVSKKLEKYLLSEKKNLNAIVISQARHISKSETVSPEKARSIFDSMRRLSKKETIKDRTTKDYIAWDLLGGNESFSWFSGIIEQMKNADDKKIIYFNVETDGEEPVEENKEINRMEQEEEKVFSEAEEEKKEEEQEKVEKPEEEKKEEEPQKEEMASDEKFSVYSALDMGLLLSMLEEDDDEAMKMAAQKIKDSDESPEAFSAVIGGMFAKMCKMAESNKAHMAEIEKKESERKDLEQFKFSVVTKQKEVYVEKVLAEIQSKFSVPDNTLAEMKEKAKNFSFENIESWEKECKYMTFDFPIKNGKTVEVTKIALPFVGSTTIGTDDMWKNIK